MPHHSRDKLQAWDDLGQCFWGDFTAPNSTLGCGQKAFHIKTFLMGIGSPWLFFISCKLYLLQPGECRITTWLCDMPAVVMSSRKGILLVAFVQLGLHSVMVYLPENLCMGLLRDKCTAAIQPGALGGFISSFSVFSTVSLATQPPADFVVCLDNCSSRVIFWGCVMVTLICCVH